MEKDNEFIFTFGSGQVHENGFYAINAENYSKAREKMVESFGIKWAFQYCSPNARKKAGVNKFNLHEVK